MSLGIYISVPFCRSKCSYCNFASGVFSRGRMERYVEAVSLEMAAVGARAAKLGAMLESSVDSIYMGGGTPTVLAPEQLARVFASVRERFSVSSDAEITVECAPGSLSDGMLQPLLRAGVNRVSLGVQSFVDQEARAVARLHDRATTVRDVERLRSAGISNINLDLIAGLPHQTQESWSESLEQLLALEPPHASVYMLEVDTDSRLGRELIAGGTRYHAHHVPDDDLIAELYLAACERLESAGIRQYEISNFARAGMESRHNRKYWSRQPYLGFGLDAHSMLPVQQGRSQAAESIRFSNPDDLESYLRNGSAPAAEVISPAQALEEEFFLGLRRNVGIDLDEIESCHGASLPDDVLQSVSELVELGLLQRTGKSICLTDQGRLLSNEVFARFISTEMSEVRSLKG